jgi:hypothetical protein
MKIGGHLILLVNRIRKLRREERRARTNGAGKIKIEKKIHQESRGAKISFECREECDEAGGI